MISPPAPLARILRDAVVEAGPRGRRALMAVGVLWAVAIALQVWDVRHRSGPHVTAELLGAFAAILGAVLLLPSWALQADAERDALRRQRTATPRVVVLALPILAGASATSFGFALAMLVMRGLLGVEIWLVSLLGAATVVALVLSLRLVRTTTQSLYMWAAEQSSLAARAEADAAQARLAALQAQLQPHFLFNALNTIAALAPADAARAERTVLNLSSLLRQTLDRASAPMTTLDAELQFARAYLDIEHERFGDRLRVRIDVPAAAASLPLPAMTLQPLLENVIKHVVQTRLAPTAVAIAAVHDDGWLRLSVSDDGGGWQTGGGAGIGLANLRARLAALYGDRGRLEIDTTPGGSRVTVVVPVIR